MPKQKTYQERLKELTPEQRGDGPQHIFFRDAIGIGKCRYSKEEQQARQESYAHSLGFRNYNEMMKDPNIQAIRKPLEFGNRENDHAKSEMNQYRSPHYGG